MYKVVAQLLGTPNAYDKSMTNQSSGSSHHELCSSTSPTCGTADLLRFMRTASHYLDSIMISLARYHGTKQLHGLIKKFKQRHNIHNTQVKQYNMKVNNTLLAMLLIATATAGKVIELSKWRSSVLHLCSVTQPSEFSFHIFNLLPSHLQTSNTDDSYAAI